MGDKILLFKYIQLELLKWYKEKNCYQDFDNNDLSILKSLKLLFFVVSVSANKEVCLLNNPFRFVAMPYGHVELDIYNYLKDSIHSNDEIIVGKRKTSIIDKHATELIENSLDLDLRFNIQEMIKTLKVLNNSLINYNAFDLVELSHRWSSWQKNYNNALNNNQRIADIDIADILNEDKLYVL